MAEFNLHECTGCGYVYDRTMYEKCPECQRHIDDIEDDIFELGDNEDDEECDEDEEDDSNKYGCTMGMSY